MRIAKKTIDSVLSKAEIEFELEPGLLSSIYEAEARVVFLGLRRGITKDLRRIIQDAVGEVEDED
jgi:hypothetical protein